MIYVPDLSYQCYVIQNADTIRAYKTKPYNPSYNQSINIEYRDYYYSSHYVHQDGTQQFSTYSTIPTCLSNDVLTDNFYYRNDFDSILIIVLIVSIFCFYIPLKIFSKLFKRGRL